MISHVGRTSRVTAFFELPARCEWIYTKPSLDPTRQSLDCLPGSHTESGCLGFPSQGESEGGRWKTKAATADPDWGS